VSETGLGFGILGIIEGVQLPNQLLNSHDRGPVTAPDGVKWPPPRHAGPRDPGVRKPTRAPMPEPARLAAPPDSSLHEVLSLPQPWDRGATSPTASWPSGWSRWSRSDSPAKPSPHGARSSSANEHYDLITRSGHITSGHPAADGKARWRLRRKPAPSSARRPRTDFLGKRGGHLGRHPRQTGTTTTAFCDSGGEGLVATMRAGRSDSGHGGRRLPSDPRPPRDAATRRVSAGILAALSATPGAERPAADLTERAAGELAARLTGRWGAGRRRRSTAPI
jgi:hypothetical protein